MPKKNKRKHMPDLFLFLAICGICCGYGVIAGDITDVREFQCTWLGGSVSGTMTCSCYEDAQEMYIEKGSIPSFDTSAIHIRNCNRVRFGSESISNARNLRNVQLINIKDLYFEEYSLFWDIYAENVNPRSYAQGIDYSDRTIPGLTFTIENSSVSAISSYTFKGRINEIIFKNVTVEQISPFAFTSLLQTIRVEFSDTSFKEIQPQAFKRFSTNYLVLYGSNFDNIPSRTFSEVSVIDHFLIEDCSFARINPSAFIINNPKQFDILNSKFEILDGDAFRVITTGAVMVKDSFFNITNGGAFLGIQLNREQVVVEQKFTFDNDTFNILNGDTLATDTRSFRAIYHNILLNQTCDCWYIDRILEDNQFYEEIHCLLDDKEQITLKEFKHYNCSLISNFSLIIIIVLVVLILLIIILAVLTVYFKRVFRGTKQKEYLNNKEGKPLGLIMPDGRTYRETELHVIVERADLLTTNL